jgi:hypothetical protein
MTNSVGLNHPTETPRWIEDPHQHFAAHARADRLLALTQFLAFVRGARPDASQNEFKPAPMCNTIADEH